MRQKIMEIIIERLIKFDVSIGAKGCLCLFSLLTLFNQWLTTRL